MTGQQETVVQTRVCIQCREEKKLQDDFRFSRRYQCYERTCKKCRSEQETNIREERRRTGTINKKEDITITSKVCKECSKEKSIDNYYFHKATGYYTNICKDCKNETRRDKFAGRDDGQKEEFKLRRAEYVKRIEDRSAIVYSACTNFDIKKNLENDLDREFVKEMMLKSCIYCGFPSTGLDRIDNKFGHYKSNCLPACRDCNVARGNNFSVEEMKIIGIGIHEVKRLRLENKEDIIKDRYHK